MKVFSVEFEPMWPVGSCLIIAAESIENAIEIASKTIHHVSEFEVEEVNISKERVIVYMDGDY